MSDFADLESLIDAIQRGRTELFGQIIRLYSLPLRSFLAAQVHHRSDIDDLAQEVFLAALESLSSFQKGADFGAWLRGIARNKLLVYFRSQSRRNQALQRFRDQVLRIVETDLEKEAQEQTADSIEKLLSCIARLPEKLRRIVRSGLAGNPASELARELNTTPGTIYNLHYRANQLLRECMSKEAT